MQTPIPTPPAIFQQLVETLEQIRFDARVIGDAFVRAVANAFLSTPFIDPLDDFSYEMLLVFSGLDFNNADDISFASAITEFLIGTDHFHLACSHLDTPSPFCLRLTSGIDAHNREQGRQAAAEGALDEALAVRDVRQRRHQTQRE